CFVRNRKLIALCQRDLNHFDFLFRMQDKLRHVIHNFFDDKLKHTFSDADFVFDVYVPPPHDRVWLIDINPWAVRTDPLLFSWLELLTLPEPPKEEVVRIPIRPAGAPAEAQGQSDPQVIDAKEGEVTEGRTDLEDDDEEADEEIWVPEFRLIRKDDPEAYSFNTPQYSAHKLPRDVVDA
ncbi:D123-domain-containing protein, partial [Aureobasidium melanogenum]